MDRPRTCSAELRRRLCWQLGIPVFVLIVVLGLISPSMADPQPPENRQAEPIVTTLSEESTPDDRLRPDTFDVRITTDAEVERLRSSVSQQLLNTAAADASAELNLDQTRVEHLQNFDEQRIALNALGQVEQAAADIAVIGFMDRHEASYKTLLQPGVETVTSRTTLTSYASSLILTQRDVALGRLKQADLAVKRSSWSLRSARARHSRTEAALRSSKQSAEAFNERVAAQRRLAIEADGRAARLSNQVDLRSVAGTLIVNEAIETAIDNLIADSRLDGIDLGGGGYRSAEEQIVLRLANCDQSHQPGDTHPQPGIAIELTAHWSYVIYQAPSSSCSPATAPPGDSLHQTGLALDFTEDGRVLTRSSAGYEWLRANAATYGLANLPGEPWHWSTTGR